jgi:hypothetical protein
MPKPKATGQERQAVRIGRTCRVCEHKDCARIELACASGRSDRKIAAEFGLRRDSVRGHWQNHVSPARKAELVGGPVVIAELARRAAEEDRSLIDFLSILRLELMHLFLRTKEHGSPYDASSVAGRLLSTLEAIGRLNGQLRAGITINNVNAVSSGPTVVLNDPAIIRMQAAIIRALGPHPEARAAVVAALRDLEGGTPSPAGLNGCHSPPLAVSGPPLIEAAVNA